MNKKLLVGVLAAGLLMTGCAPKDVIAIQGKTMHVVGDNLVMVDNEWKANEWAPTKANEMRAISLHDVQKLDKASYKSLKDKEIVGLYYGEVALGTKNDSSWKASAMKDGEKVELDASYALKCIRATYEEEDNNYLNDQWISNPKDAHVDALNENVFCLPFQEEADENGFTWDGNIVCIGEAGRYGVILAQYGNASSVDQAGFGIGLVYLGAAE